MNASWQSKSHSWRSSPFVLWDIVAVFCLHWPHQIARTSCRIVWRKKILVDCKTTSFQLTKNIYRCYLKLASAIFYQFFIFLPSDSPSNTVKNVFFFIFLFLSTLSRYKDFFRTHPYISENMTPCVMFLLSFLRIGIFLILIFNHFPYPQFDHFLDLIERKILFESIFYESLSNLNYWNNHAKHHFGNYEVISRQYRKFEKI